MKVLTLHQPWASLIALGVKTIETRSWSTTYRGPLAIHAAKKVVYGRIGNTLTFNDAAPTLSTIGTNYALPLGAIVATCTLVDVVPMVEGHLHEQTHVSIGRGLYLDTYTPGNGVSTRDLFGQRPYGDFTPGRYAWLLADVVPVDPPVPFRGGQGLTKTWEPSA